MKRNPHHKVAEEALKRGFVLIGLYTTGKKKIRFRCLTYNEIHYAQPTNILQGQGLKCCQLEGQRLGQKSFNDQARKEYDEKLRLIGKIERIGDYINNKKAIEHRCLIHNEIHKSSPSNALRGGGLMCCQIATRERSGRRYIDEAAKSLASKLKEKNPTIIWVGGEYKGAKSKLDFLCTEHDEVHSAQPSNVLTGQGLKCCHRASVSEVGKTTGILNSRLIDNVWRALTGQLNSPAKNTFLYLFESPLEGYNKFGISNKSGRRAKEGGYGLQLIEPREYPNRVDAVLIEQAFKYGYGEKTPKELRGWPGRSELTKLNPEEFLVTIIELEEALADSSRWEFADSYCNPRELKIARDFMKGKEAN